MENETNRIFKVGENMEDLKKSIKRLEEKIDKNSIKIDSNVETIIANMNKLHSHEEKINSNAERIQQNSFALDILKDIQKDSDNLAVSNKRFYKLLIIIIILWFATIGYLIYVLNDIGTIEEITNQNVVQETENGFNNFIGRDGEING